MTRRLTYTPEEDAFLRENYGVRDIAFLAISLGRNKNQIIGRARRLGLAKAERNPNIKRMDGPAKPTKAKRQSRPLQRTKKGRYKHCQWIAGNPTANDDCKCNKPTFNGVYCESHLRKAYMEAKGSGTP